MRDFSVNPDISKAHTIHTDFYTSREVFEHCKEKIFAKSWQFIGSQDLVKQNNQVYPFTLLKNFLDEPLVLARDKTGDINLLSNVCTHRGNLVATEVCSVQRLRCKYHGRTFSLDGKFHSMPEFKEVADFPTAADDLAKLPLFTWNKWLFTSLEQKFEPGIFLNDMMNRVRWMPLDKFVFKPELSRDFHVKANWALYCENYLEGFHIPFVHAGLNEHLDFEESATELFFPYSNLQIGISKKSEDCFELPASSPDYGKKIAAYYFWVFPNMMFNFYPWGLSVNVVTPVAESECVVSFYSYVWDESKMDAGAGSGLDKVEMEDEEIVERVQSGVRSRFYNKGRYSVTKEKGTHHFHRILAEFMK
jgi:choline monooxygenase